MYLFLLVILLIGKAKVYAKAKASKEKAALSAELRKVHANLYQQSCPLSSAGKFIISVLIASICTAIIFHQKMQHSYWQSLLF